MGHVRRGVSEWQRGAWEGATGGDGGDGVGREHELEAIRISVILQLFRKHEFFGFIGRHAKGFTSCHARGSTAH